MRFVKPLDEGLLDEIFQNFEKVITVEDGCLMGGFGSAVIEYMVEKGYSAHLKRLGIPDDIIEHGTQHELQCECGYDTDGIVKTVLEMIPSKISV